MTRLRMTLTLARARLNMQVRHERHSARGDPEPSISNFDTRCMGCILILAGRAVIMPAPESSADHAKLHALLAQASITSLPSIDTLRSVSISMAPTAEYIAAMKMSGMPEAMRGPGEALAGT